MKEKLFNILENTGELTVQMIVLNIAMAAALGFIIYISYYFSHIGTIYSKKFNVSLIVMTVLTGTVMTVIGNNIALSLGMVGALSIVRFRTAINDSRDTMYIIWAVIVGICCGVGDYLVAAIGSAFTFVILLALGAIKNDNRMLLIIRASRSRQSVIQAQVFKLFNHKAVLRVRNASGENIEMIYEISSRILQKAERDTINVTDSIMEIGGVEYVNIVMQNDEVSN